jgi:hypothetical protein
MSDLHRLGPRGGLTLADIIEDAGYPGVATDLRGDFTPEEALAAARDSDRILRRGQEPSELTSILEAWALGRELAP